MIITIVCREDGCRGNRFRINTDKNKIIITCAECGKLCNEIDITGLNFKIAPNCSKCNSEIFKVFKDKDENRIFFQCVECSSPPRYLYYDDEGKQITYEQMKMVKMEREISKVNDRMNDLIDDICSLGYKIDELVRK